MFIEVNTSEWSSHLGIEQQDSWQYKVVQVKPARKFLTETQKYGYDHGGPGQPFFFCLMMKTSLSIEFLQRLCHHHHDHHKCLNHQRRRGSALMNVVPTVSIIWGHVQGLGSLQTSFLFNLWGCLSTFSYVFLVSSSPGLYLGGWSFMC